MGCILLHILTPGWPQGVTKSLAVPGGLKKLEMTESHFCFLQSTDSIQQIQTLYLKKKSRREGSAKASPLPPPIELIKTLLCCHGCVDQLREGSSVQQEPRQVGLNVHKAREQRHEKFELSMKGKQCQQRRRHGHSSTILNVCNRQIKRRGKS